jgi:hypothetical protein
MSKYKLAGNIEEKLTSSGYFLFPFVSLAAMTATNQAVTRILK